MTALTLLEIDGDLRISGQSLQLPSLASLEMTSGATVGPPHACTSQLTHLYICQGLLPEWSARLPALTVTSWSAFQDRHPSALPISAWAVTSLTTEIDPVDIHAKALLQEVLLLRALKQLTVEDPRLDSPCVTLTGSLQDHRRLLASTKLSIPKSSNLERSDGDAKHNDPLISRLNDNGHLQGCLCQLCDQYAVSNR